MLRRLTACLVMFACLISSAQGLALQDPHAHGGAPARHDDSSDSFAAVPRQSPTPADQQKEAQKKIEQLQEAVNKPETWDVEGDHGPSKTVEFETDEGTWMSCDVSPDGAKIVFDILGDIYGMPITGGRAELLAGGVSYESQPRYSPDGKWISFTSDRDGGDNIWVMDPQGKNRRQVTKETNRLVNNAVWSPDGQYLVVRKHFVDTRSLGAGEIWMYHVNGGGGKGVQLTERPNWTANIGEPAVDPKNRFVYFVASSAFEYNKNVYDSIYWIERYDMEKGRRSVYARSAGGSVRPQVSPDGKHLAFIRRVGAKSVLFLREIESGREWSVYDDLTRDQQEAWAIFGTYPGYAWTPDAKSIVITARGKFVRVNVETKQATPIPFTARVSQKVANAVRFTQKVSPDRDTTKLLRWAERHGEGVVYGALGKIYVKRGDAAPTKLLNTSGFEYAPNMSHDGSKMTYVTWTDADKGAVWVANADGSDARKITTNPDLYANPVFSPDGSKVAYLKGRGTIFTEDNLASESSFEIHYWDGAKNNYVLDVQSRGPNARMPILSFDPEGERVYYNEGVSSPPSSPTTPAVFLLALNSVKLDGDDVKRHIEGNYLTEIIPSPDHKWIAFKELHKLYVAPFPKTGKTVKLSAVDTSVPVKSFAPGSGAWLTWSPDSKSVGWTLGENFHEQTLDNVFKELAKGEKAAPPKTTKIGFEFETAKPRGTVALTNARIVTMRGDEVIERGTILVEGNRIKAVGARVSIPAGARRIDMAGKTIAPGIVDVHAHMGYDTLDIVPEKQWPYYANLAYGVTTTHDPSAATQTTFAQSEMVKSGALVGPRIFSTGYILYGAENTEKAVVNSLADARGHLERLKAVGAFSVKSYNQLRRDARQRVIKAARDTQMMVVPEGGSTYYYNMTHVLDGHTGLEHSIPVAPLYKDALTLLAKSATGYTPTLIVAYGGLSGENLWYQESNVWENEKLMRFTPRKVIEPRARRRQMADEDDYFHVELAKSVRDVVRNGGRAQLGAHGQLQGLGAHWELWMLQQGGMTPLEALRCATLYGAQYLGLDRDLGSIEPGKLADLMILDKNPLANIRHSDSVSFVMMNGVLYDAKNMDEVWPQARPRGKFFWER